MKKLSLLLLVLAAFVTANAQPYLVGHRGSYWGVENTEEAFINGAKKGYHCLETDVKVTKDGKFVCWHDDNLTKADGSPQINANTLATLQSKKLTQTRGDVTYTGYLTTFERYLDICKEYNVIPVIEFKWADGINSNDCSNIPAVVNMIESKGLRNKCYIFTSMQKCLQYVKTNYPDMEIMYLCYDTSFDSSYSWCTTNKSHIGPGVGSGVTKAGVQKYHDAGLLVNAWTVNSTSDYKTYGNYGCDFITTDYLNPAELPTLSTPTTMLSAIKTSASDVSLVAGVGETVYQDVTVSGSNMGSAVTVSCSNSAFTVTNNTSYSNGSVSGTIRISYKPTTEGVATGIVTLKGTNKSGAEVTSTISVTGKCSLKFEEVWNYSETSGKAPATGTNWTSDKVALRNLACGNGKVYTVNPSASTITVANAQTGAYIGSINTTGVSGGVFGVMDIKVVGEKLVGCNLATSTDALKVYVWDTDNSTPREILNTTNKGECTRVGDTFEVKGDMTNGEILFLSGASILKYTITNGVVATTPTVITVKENGTNIDAGSSPRVIAQADGKYWVVGRGIYPKLVSSTGTVELTLNAALLNNVINGNEFQPFTFKGKQYAFATTYSSGLAGCRAVLIDASNGWNNAVNMGEYPSAGLGTTSNDNINTSVEVIVNGNSGVEMWVNSCKQGIAYYKYGSVEVTEPEVPETPETPEEPAEPETPGVSEPTLTKVWSYESGLPAVDGSSISSTEAAYGTGYNGTVYTIDKANKTIWSWNNSTQKLSYASNDNFTGTAITCDDAGNILVNQGIYSTSATTWNIVAASSKAVTPVTVTYPSDIASGNTYHVGRVVGNMLSSEGAYVYLTRAGVNKVACVKIANGQFVSATASSVMTDITVQTVSYAQPSKETVAEIESSTNPADCFYFRDRSSKNFCYLNGSALAKFAIPSNVHTTDGGDVVVLGGKTYLVYPTGNGSGTAYGSAFVIVEGESGDVVAEEETSVSAKTYYQSLVAEKVNDTKANIYQFYGGGKVAMYTFEVPGDATAIESVEMEEVEAPVEYYNLQGVRVANPEKGLFIKKQGKKVTKVIL